MTSASDSTQAPSLRRLWRTPGSLFLLAAMVFVAAAAVHFARLYRWNVVDDAYISFQYAKNWIEGQGLVFNPGERVEGYTNFLWIVLLAPVFALGKAASWDLTSGAIVLNIVVALINLVLAYALGLRMFRGNWLASSLVVALCALDNSFQAYAMSGLENHLCITWVLAAALTIISGHRRAWPIAGVLLALLTMTRPDGFLALAALVPAAIWEVWPRKDERKARLRELGQALGAFAGVYGVYFIARYAYFGSPLPNTFYLKVGYTFAALQRGLDYTGAFLAERYYIPLLAVVALFGRRHWIANWFAIFIALHIAYITYVGGDFYSGHRFYVVLLPCIYLLVGTVAHRKIEAYRASASKAGKRPLTPWLALGATAFVLYHFALLGYQRGPYTAEIVRWADAVDNNVRYMKWLGKVAPPGASMVVGDIGATGFFAGLRVIDVFGVVDPVVARQNPEQFGRGKPGHEKVAPASYLLDKQPTFIKWGYIHTDLHSRGYYVFNNFPPDIQADGLWVREDLTGGRYLTSGAMHFRPSELEGWVKEGEAFAQSPSTGTVRGQRMVFGQAGPYINSYSAKEGDRATGRLVSPSFELAGDLMVLRVGGGRDPNALRVSLLIDGKPVHSATGNDSEVLGRRIWNIAPYRGKQAQLEVLDEATGRWGHILVDEVLQWSWDDGTNAPVFCLAGYES